MKLNLEKMKEFGLGSSLASVSLREQLDLREELEACKMRSDEVARAEVTKRYLEKMCVRRCVRACACVYVCVVRVFVLCIHVCCRPSVSPRGRLPLSRPRTRNMQQKRPRSLPGPRSRPLAQVLTANSKGQRMFQVQQVACFERLYRQGFSSPSWHHIARLECWHSCR